MTGEQLHFRTSQTFSPVRYRITREQGTQSWFNCFCVACSFNPHRATNWEYEEFSHRALQMQGEKTRDFPGSGEFVGSLLDNGIVQWDH